MQLNEIRHYASQRDFKFINAFEGKREFSYSIDRDGNEIFQVKFYLSGAANGKNHYRSLSFKLHKGEKVPKTYQKYLDALKEQFSIVDWNFGGSKKIV